MVFYIVFKMQEEGQWVVSIEIFIIKFFVVDVMQWVVDRVLQVYGVLGIIDDIILFFFYWEEWGVCIYDGLDEVYKVLFVCKILK